MILWEPKSAFERGIIPQTTTAASALENWRKLLENHHPSSRAQQHLQFLPYCNTTKLSGVFVWKVTEALMEALEKSRKSNREIGGGGRGGEKERESRTKNSQN